MKIYYERMDDGSFGYVTCVYNDAGFRGLAFRYPGTMVSLEFEIYSRLDRPDQWDRKVGREKALIRANAIEASVKKHVADYIKSAKEKGRVDVKTGYMDRDNPKKEMTALADVEMFRNATCFEDLDPAMQDYIIKATERRIYSGRMLKRIHEYEAKLAWKMKVKDFKAWREKDDTGCNEV